MWKINIVATRHFPITPHNTCPDIYYNKWKFDILNTMAGMIGVFPALFAVTKLFTKQRQVAF